MQVLMVLFDIMASHWAMSTWHDARMVESAAALAQLQQVSLSCKPCNAAAQHDMRLHSIR